MAKRFSAKYSAEDELSRMINTMKHARKATGYSQEQFGKLIGLSRETVNHIEGLVECTVLTLECEVLKRWYSICANKVGEYEREALQNAVNQYFFSSALSLNSSTSSIHSAQKPSDTDPVNNSKPQQQKVA